MLKHKKVGKWWKLLFKIFSVILVGLLLGIFVSQFVFTPKDLTGNQKGAVKSVPELAQILDSSDQDGQLKATRALAERVGPEKAMDILKDSGLPYTGEGHFAVHQIGYVAWEQYGKEALLHCKDYFLYACYHGAIIEAASKSGGFGEIKNMTEVCRDFEPRYLQCVHAAGHAILAMWNYEVDKALPTCDQLYENDSQYPGALVYCHAGVFMENIFGVHDWGKDNPNPARKWLSDSDVNFPCDAFEDKYLEGCWQNQAARIYQMMGGDLERTASLCNKVTPAKYIPTCFDDLSRQIHPLTGGNVQKVYELCKTTGEKWADMCVSVNAGAFFSVGDPRTGIQVCNNAPKSGQRDCFGRVISYLPSLITDKTQREDLCKLMIKSYDQECLSKLR